MRNLSLSFFFFILSVVIAFQLVLVCNRRTEGEIALILEILSVASEVVTGEGRIMSLWFLATHLRQQMLTH